MNKKKKSKKKLIILIIVLVVVVLLVRGCLGIQANITELLKTTYDIVDVDRGTIEVKVKGAGTVEPMESNPVYAVANGTVSDVFFENGDVVNEGDVIAVIDSDALESEKSSLKQQIGELDLSILTARSTSGGESVVSPVKGVVKAVFAAEGDSVDAVVERDGALAVICPDDLMQTVVSGEIAVGDAVTVTVGTQSTDGVVVSTSGNNATVQFEDSDFVVGDNALVTDSAGAEIGNGKVAVAHPVYVSAHGGTIDDVRVAVGDEVKRGGKLFTLDGEILSDTLYSLLEQRESLQEDLDDLISDIDNLSVRADLNGVVTDLSLKKGQTVQQGEALFTVQSSDAMKIDVEIDELDIANIEIGDEVTVTFDALADETFNADIIKINPVGSAQNNVTKYTLTLSLDDADSVMLGMSADVQIISQRAEDVLLIPIEAIQTINGEKYVVFETDIDDELNSTPATHRVVTGVTDGVNIEVIEGLSEGDRVAVPQVEEQSLQERMWSYNHDSDVDSATGSAE